MHNALVLGIDTSKENCVSYFFLNKKAQRCVNKIFLIQVRVVFCNPTNQEMKICEHFMSDTCRFNENCKFSHGYQVNVEDLHSYLEPNYEYISFKRLHIKQLRI